VRDPVLHDWNWSPWERRPEPVAAQLDLSAGLVVGEAVDRFGELHSKFDAALRIGDGLMRFSTRPDRDRAIR
jgi:hypothetical protein